LNRLIFPSQESKNAVIDPDVIILSDDEEKESCIQSNFMANFGLGRLNQAPPSSFVPAPLITPLGKKEQVLERSIPFSSPAGRYFTKQSSVSPEYVTQRLQTVELNCAARRETKLCHLRRKQHQLKGFQPMIFKSMRKSRIYSWPKRQFHSRPRIADFFFLNRPMILQLKPCTISLKKLEEEEAKAFQSLRTCKVFVKGLSVQKIRSIMEESKMPE
jgi:hypothetical protein